MDESSNRGRSVLNRLGKLADLETSDGIADPPAVTRLLEAASAGGQGPYVNGHSARPYEGRHRRI